MDSGSALRVEKSATLKPVIKKTYVWTLTSCSTIPPPSLPLSNIG